MADQLQQRKFDSFTIINNGLIETDLLTEHEKIVYIVIKKHLNQKSQTAFPGMATIAREARICKSVVIKAIQGLEEKGLLIVKRQTTKYNETKTNRYHFNEFSELWKAKTVDELKKIAAETSIQITDDEIINKALQIDKKKRQRLYNQLAKEFAKKREPEALPADQSNNDSSTQLNISKQFDNTLNLTKSQVLERYTINQIRQIFDYDIMIHDNPYSQQDIDSVMDILYTALNTNKETIRIAGQDKPTMVVISKLMKLHTESILYAIKLYKQQTQRIKNPTSYMLTILYNAPEQFNLDIQNQVSHNTAYQNRVDRR